MDVPLAFLEWITPNSCAAFNRAIAKVLALPLLWASYEREYVCNGKSYSIIPEDLAAQIKEKWISAGGDVNMNPIEKIPLEARHNGDQLVLVPLVHRGDADADENNNGGVAAAAMDTTSFVDGVVDSDRDVLLAQNHLLQQCVEDMKNEMISILAEHRQYMVTINSNVGRIATQPVVRRSVLSSSSARAANPAADRHSRPAQPSHARARPSVQDLFRSPLCRHTGPGPATIGPSAHQTGAGPTAHQPVLPKPFRSGKS